MTRILSLSLAALMLVAALAGCSGKPSGGDDKQLTAEERTELYKTAIENARSAEDNEYNPLLTETDDDTDPIGDAGRHRRRHEFLRDRRLHDERQGLRHRRHLPRRRQVRNRAEGPKCLCGHAEAEL